MFEEMKAKMMNHDGWMDGLCFSFFFMATKTGAMLGVP
jgi:hypothetical protein